MHSKIDFVNADAFFFCCDSVALMWQHAADWIMARIHWGQTHNSFQLEARRSFSVYLLHQLQTVPCCWQRICRWHWKKFLQPAARTSFCLSPKSYRPTQISVGWLEERRKVMSSKTLLHLFTHNSTKLFVREEERKGGEAKEQDRWKMARQVMQKQVRLFLDQIKKRWNVLLKKKEIWKVQSKVRTKQSDENVKGRIRKNSGRIWDRLKGSRVKSVKEERLKWTKRKIMSDEMSQPESGTYLDVWCRSWVPASLPTLKCEETTYSSRAAMFHFFHRCHVIMHRVTQGATVIVFNSTS